MKKIGSVLLLLIFLIGFVGCASTTTLSQETDTTNIDTTELLTTQIDTTEGLTTSIETTIDREYFVDVEMGYIHSIALTNKGRVYTWGSNDYGQLGGFDSYMYADEPIDITNRFNLTDEETIIGVDCGHYHTMALSSENRLFVWGRNEHLQVPGYGSLKTSVPQDVTDFILLEEDEQIVNMDAGAGYSGILTSLNRVIVWGHNGASELGFVSDETNVGPTDITGKFPLLEGEFVADFEIGYRHTGILTSQGRVFIWGDNSAGQIGNQSNADVQKIPSEINWFFDEEQVYDIAKLDLGYWFSSATTTTGRLFMWGSNLHGELGIDNHDLQKRDYPIDMTEYFELEDNDYIEQVYLGGFHSFAKTHQGEIYAWGVGFNGRLAYSFNGYIYKPALVTERFELEEGESIVSINLGLWTSSMLSSDGRLFVWGANDVGQLGLGNTTDYAYPVEISILD